MPMYVEVNIILLNQPGKYSFDLPDAAKPDPNIHKLDEIRARELRRGIITFASLPVHRHQETLRTRAKDLAEGVEADMRAAAVVDSTLVLVLTGVVVGSQVCA